MALAVSGVTPIFDCDTDGMDGGTGVLDSDVFIEGAGSLKLKVSNTLSSVAKYDQGGAGGVDMSGKHFGIWVMSPAVFDTDTNGGIRCYFEDTSGNWKECYVSGSDSYPGGWSYLVCSYDATGQNTSGTYSSAAHRYCGVRFKTLSKSVKENVWWDAMHYFNELTCTSGVADQVDLDDLVDWCKTDGNGLFVEYNGAYFCKTGIYWGSTTAGLHIDFKDIEKKVFMVENTFKSSTLYKWNVQGNSTGTINYVTGNKSGTVGIQGIEIIDLNTSNYITIDFDDSNIDKLQVYGGGFTGVGTIKFPSLTGANYECINIAFTSHGIVTCNTFKIEKFNSISATSDSFTVSSATFNVKYGNIIDPTDNGISVSADIDLTLYDIVFSGTDGISSYDIENTHANLIEIGNDGTSNAQYENENPGSIDIVTSVDLTIYVQDEDKNPIQDAQTSIHLLDSPFTALMNEDTLVTGYAEETYNYPGSTVDIVVKTRKSDSADDPRYQAFSAIGTITAAGFLLAVTLKEQPLPI